MKAGAASRLYATAAGNSTLVVIEHNGKAVTAGTLASITAAQKIGGSITAFVAGSTAADVAKEVCPRSPFTLGGEKEINFLLFLFNKNQQVRKISGVNRVIVANNAAFDNGLPEVYAPAISSLQTSNKFTHLLSVNSAFGKNLMPSVSALLDVAQISDVIEVKNPETFVRPFYAGLSPEPFFIHALPLQTLHLFSSCCQKGNAIATVTTSDKVKVLTVRQTAFPKAAAGSAEAAVEDFKGEVPKSEGSKHLSATLSKSDRPELTSSTKIVSGGRALKSSENFKIIYDLADKMGAAVGASRAAVDAGYVPNDLQVFFFETKDGSPLKP